MRSIHFRVEDDLYMRIQEEAEQQDLSIASFARVATVARTILWGVRRGAPWADLEAWGEAVEIIEEIERRDTAARAKLAKERRVGRTFTEKLSGAGSTAVECSAGRVTARSGPYAEGSRGKARETSWSRATMRGS